MTAHQASALLLLLLPLPQLADVHQRAVYSPPSGWTKEVLPTFVTHTRVAQGTFCQLALYDERPAQGTVPQSFASEWSAVFGRNFLPSPAPPATLHTTPAGYAFLAGESEVADRMRNRFYARLAVFSVPPSSVQSILLIAQNKATLASCEPEWTALMQSLRYPAASTASPQPLSSSRPTRIRYTVPPGWEEVRNANLVTIRPVRLHPLEQLAIVLLPSRPLGPLESQLAATWDEIVATHGAQPMRNVSGQAFDPAPVRRTVAGWDYITAEGGLRINAQVFTVRPYLFRVRDRIERLYVLAADFRAELLTTNAMSSPRLQPDIYRFLFSLNFTGEAEAAPRAPAHAEGKGIEGVWGGSSMAFGALKLHMAIFFSDGSAYFAPRFPYYGLLDIDPSIEREREPRYWGTWSLNGSNGELRMPYGNMPLRREANTLILTTSGTPHRYIRLAAPAPEALTGTWCLATSGPCLSLTTDRRFRDDGLLRIVEHATYPYPLTLPSGAGSYEYRHNTLLFRYESGAEFRVALPGQPADKPDPRPPQIWMGFNFDVLTRR